MGIRIWPWSRIAELESIARARAGIIDDGGKRLSKAQDLLSIEKEMVIRHRRTIRKQDYIIAKGNFRDPKTGRMAKRGEVPKALRDEATAALKANPVTE